MARDAAAKNCEPVWLEAALLPGNGNGSGSGKNAPPAASAVVLRVTPAAGSSWSLSLPLFVGPAAAPASSPASNPSSSPDPPRAAPRVSCAGPPGACALDAAPPCSSGVEARAGVGALSARWQSVPGGCQPGGATADVSPALKGLSGGSPLVYGLKATYFTPVGGYGGCASGPRDLNSLLLPPTADNSTTDTTFTRCQEGADFQAWGGDPFAGSPQLDPSRFGGCFGAVFDGFVSIPKVEKSQIEWRSSTTADSDPSSSSSASSVDSVTRRFRVCARFTGRADVRLGALSLSPADGGSGRSFPGDVVASVADATLVCQDVGGLDPGLAPLYVKYAAPPAGAAVLQVWVIPVAAAWRVAQPSDGLVVAGSGGGGGNGNSSPWRVEFACSCCALFGDGSGGAGGGAAENGRKCCAPVDTCSLRTWSDCGRGSSSPPPPPPETTQPPPPPPPSETTQPPETSPPATTTPPPSETTQPPPPPPETTQPPPETTQPPPPPETTQPPPPETTQPPPPPPETTFPPTTGPPQPKQTPRRTNVLNQGVQAPPRKTPAPAPSLAADAPAPAPVPVPAAAAAPGPSPSSSVAECCLYSLQMSHPAAGGDSKAAMPVVVAAASGGNASVAIVCDGAAAPAALSLSPSDVVVAGAGGGASVAALAPFRVPEGNGSSSSSRSIWIATVLLPPPSSFALDSSSSSLSSGVVTLALAPDAAGGLARASAPLSFRVPPAASPSSSSSSSPARGTCGLVETTVAEVS